MRMKDRIIPIPRDYTALDGAPALLGCPGKANYKLVNETCTDSCSVLATADKLLRDTLKKLLNVCPCSADGAVTITLKLGEAPADAKNADQGYCLEITDKAVTLVGFGSAGLYYGVVTLTQCMALENGKLELEACRIVDWPELRTRGHFMESRFGSNLMTLDDWKGVVDHMASMKQNQLVVSIYGCWCVQYDMRLSEFLYVPLKNHPELRTPRDIRYYSPKKQGFPVRVPPMYMERAP